MDKVSYALGLGIGSQLKSMGADSLNIDDFAQAIKDTISGAELKVSHKESQQIRSRKQSSALRQPRMAR